MTHRPVRYYIGEEERWAIWSTVSDGFVAWDMDAEEVVEQEAQRAYERRQKEVRDVVEELRENNRRHQHSDRGYRPDKDDLRDLLVDSDE
jgi:hypothetical protein